MPSHVSRLTRRRMPLSEVMPCSGKLWANGRDAEADVVVPSLRLEPQPEGGAARPAVVRPRPSPPDPRRSRGVVEVRVDAAGELRVVPVAAPLKGVAVHVMQAPGVG